MSRNENCDHNSEYRMITCIFNAETNVQTILCRLKDEKHIFTAGTYHARGIGGSAHFRRGFANVQEKNVLITVVPQVRADEIFSYLYEVGEIYLPHHGMMYMEKIDCATSLTLPDDLPDLESFPQSH